ncbi:MAG TPA: hypothetical protein VN688_30135 [Gemmataceae bacterium]|nr:hypothetical protein [Gemmataceae bacterium]
MASFACPQCKQTLLVADAVLGRNVKCPKCGTIFATRAPASPPAVPSAPATPPKRPASAEQIAKRPAHIAPPRPKPVEDAVDLLPADRSPVSNNQGSKGGHVTFTAIVRNDPEKLLKGRHQGSLSPEGVRLQQGKKRTALIPLGTPAKYLGGSRLAIELDGRTVQLQIAKWISYQNRLAEDLVSYLHGDRSSLPNSSYILPWYFVVFVLLPIGIPILTLGGALPGAVGFGLCGINAMIVQREKWPGVLRGFLAAGLALLGYLGIGALVLGTALLHYYRAEGVDTKKRPVSVQRTPPAVPAGNPPAPREEPKPPSQPKPDDLKPGPAIPRFYTAVVDPQAHLALFVEGQQLVRCDYPAFKQTGAYSLGELSAYASVLDQARGLLYLAVSKPQMLQGTNSSQRLLGMGDIHVHDGRALREGKLKDGAVLQPTAVIPLGKKIARLILSPDGRWLYYLDITNDKSPKIGRVDTMTHQSAGEIALLEKTAEICLTPDGKTLYAAGQPMPGKGAVQVIDPAELKVQKEVPLPGSPYGLDATDQGMVFVSLRGQWTDTVAVDVKQGTVTMRWGGMYGACPVRLAPDQKRLYVAVTELSPSMLQAWKLPENAGDKPQKAAEERGAATPQFLITSDGRFLLTRAGKSFRLAGDNGP